jgi:hypothetical protein
MLPLLAMVGFFLFPTLPVAQTIRRIWGAVGFARMEGRGSWRRAIMSRWFLVSCLGVALPSVNGGRRRIDNNLRPRQKRYDMLWFGRMLVLLFLVAQYCGTIFLWIRRSRQQKLFCLWALDDRNLEVVLVGLWAVFLSIGISLLNTEWRMIGQDRGDRLEADDEEDNGQVELERVSTGPLIPGGMDGTVAGDLRSRWSNIRRHDRHQLTHVHIAGPTERQLRLGHAANLSALRNHTATISKIKDFTTSQFRKFRQFNVRLSKAALKYYPHELQWDFELAYLLHLVFYCFIPVQFSGGLDLEWEGPSRMPYHFAATFFRDRLQGPLVKVIPSCDEGCLARFEFLAQSIFLLPVLVIIFHCLCLIVSSDLNMFKIPLPVYIQDLLRQADFWLRSGRTVFSLLASLLMVLPFVMQFNLFTADVYWYRPAEEWLRAIPGKADSFSRWQREMLWKDPISDSLYII